MRGAFRWLSAVIVVVAAGCYVDTQTSPEELFAQLQTDINAGSVHVAQNIHPGVDNYTQIKDSSYWQRFFPTDQGQQYVISAERSDRYRDYFVGTLNGGGTTYVNARIAFHLREDGVRNWRIWVLQIPGQEVVSGGKSAFRPQNYPPALF